MKKLLNIYRFIPTCLIMLMVFLPFLANFFIGNVEPLDNRPLYERPTKLTKTFSSEFENYYNDSFAFRKSLLKRYIKLQKKLKIDTGRYFNGLDGWMFYDSAKVSDGNTILDYKGEVYFSDSEMAQMLKGVKAARDFYARKGIKYMLVVAPNKENIYSEYMPHNLQKVRKSDKSRSDVVLEYIAKNSNVTVVNLKDTILDAKKDYPMPLYFYRDTHWNNVGGYLGFGEIVRVMKNMGYNIPYKKPVDDMIFISGRQAMDMDMTQTEDMYKVKYMSHVDVDEMLNDDNGKLIVYRAKKAPINQSMLMLRDSFAAELAPFFSKAFTTSVFLHRSEKAHAGVDGYLKKYKPTIVIDEVVERRTDKLLDYLELYKEK